MAAETADTALKPLTTALQQLDLKGNGMMMAFGVCILSSFIKHFFRRVDSSLFRQRCQRPVSGFSGPANAIPFSID